MKTGILSAFTAGIMALGLSFTPAPAHALSLKVSSGGDSVTCLGDPGCGGGAGVVGYSTLFGGSPIGNFNAIGITGFGPNIYETFDHPKLDLDGLVRSTEAGTLTIELSEVGFTANPPSTVKGFERLLTGLTGGTVTVDYFIDLGNNLFGTATSLGSLSGTGLIGESNSLPLIPSSPYSLTIVAQIIHTGATITSFDTQLVAAPEPSTIFLFGSGLVGLAAWRMRKNNANQ